MYTLLLLPSDVDAKNSQTSIGHLVKCENPVPSIWRPPGCSAGLPPSPASRRSRSTAGSDAGVARAAPPPPRGQQGRAPQRHHRRRPHRSSAPSAKLPINFAQNDWENDWEMQHRRRFCSSLSADPGNRSIPYLPSQSQAFAVYALRYPVAGTTHTQWTHIATSDTFLEC